MRKKVQKLKGCKRLLEIEIPAAELKRRLEELTKEASKVAKVPGFRPGKVPSAVLKRLHGKSLEEEALRELISESYRKRIQEENLDVISFAQVHEGKKDKEGGFSFKAEVEVRPEVSIGSYRGIKIKRLTPQVKDEDVEKALSSLQKIKGEKEKAVFLNDEFAKKLGFFSLKELKEAVRKRLLFQAQMDATSKMEEELFEKLIESSQLEIPPSYLEGEFNRLKRDFRLHLASRSLKDDQIDAQLKNAESSLREMAERKVKIYFILEEIAQIENINVSKEELADKIEELAKTSRLPQEKMESLKENLTFHIRQRKTIDFLFKNAHLY